MFFCSTSSKNLTPQQQELAGRKHNIFKKAITLALQVLASASPCGADRLFAILTFSVLPASILPVSLLQCAHSLLVELYIEEFEP